MRSVVGRPGNPTLIEAHAAIVHATHQVGWLSRVKRDFFLGLAAEAAILVHADTTLAVTLAVTVTLAVCAAVPATYGVFTKTQIGSGRVGTGRRADDRSLRRLLSHCFRRRIEQPARKEGQRSGGRAC